MIIEINDEGLFEKTPEKIMYVPFGSTILFMYIGKTHAQSTPLLLTNFRNKDDKKFQISSNEQKAVTLGQIYTEFNFVKGDYEVNLNWSCQVHFDHPGVYFFQLIFVDKLGEEGETTKKVAVPNHFEYIIVNPTYTSFSAANIQRLAEGFPETNRSQSPMKVRGGWPPMHDVLEVKRLQSLQGIHEREASPLRLITQTSLANVDLKCHLNFDAISLVTLYPTMMGPIAEWEAEFDYLHKRGFHGFHLSPIQQLGTSNSLYAIKDPLVLNETIFGENGFDRLAHLLHTLKLRHQLFFVVDIIWNHCSVDSTWILDEPASYYSPKSHPALAAAFELDQSLNKVSEDFKTLGITQSGNITTSDDVEKIVGYLRTEVFGKLALHEFFQVDVEDGVRQLTIQGGETPKEVQNLLRRGSSNIIFIDSDEVNLFNSHVESLGCARFGASVSVEWLRGYLPQRQNSLTEFEYGKLLKQINQKFQQKCSEWIDEALENIRKEIIQRFLGSSRGEVSSGYPLVQRYFHKLPNGDYGLLNGVVRGADCLEDLKMDQQQWYLRRSVQVWDDSIKLNYQTQDKCPLLWRRMNDYTKRMALLFDGFRLNNFQSTNTETAKYFINNAIQVNESLFLFSELNSSSPKRDVNFCLKVGVHRLVRELQPCTSLGDVLGLIQDHLAEASNLASHVPTLCENNYEMTYLKASKPLPIICDSTYDTSSYFEKYSIFVQLPLLALENMVSLMTGTLRGFDELFTHTLPSNSPKRYPRLDANAYLDNSESYWTYFVVNPDQLRQLIRRFASVC